MIPDLSDRLEACRLMATRLIRLLDHGEHARARSLALEIEEEADVAFALGGEPTVRDEQATPDMPVREQAAE